ncbi:hypothetical protein WMY93_009666 [Mugilogobius chulae]|uniref:Uncharacterized protein n=1 Tax=Mugilogobius chulae TaxID=88201 RepID=A0AAW0PIM0_9GOBI
MNNQEVLLRSIHSSPSFQQLSSLGISKNVSSSGSPVQLPSYPLLEHWQPVFLPCFTLAASSPSSSEKHGRTLQMDTGNWVVCSCTEAGLELIRAKWRLKKRLSSHASPKHSGSERGALKSRGQAVWKIYCVCSSRESV